MIPDHDQRRQAVLTPDHAFVWASAGTGKTHTLTLRALFLLLTAPFQARAAGTECARLYTAANRPDRLRAARAVLRRFVLTTFTRKAAAEMQTRLYEYLDRIASAPTADELQAALAALNGGRGDDQFAEVVAAACDPAGGFDRLRAGAEALAELATELPVCTLHSYAAAILRRHPIAAGIPPSAQFAEEDDISAVAPADQLVERWWQHAATDAGRREQLARLLAAVSVADLRAWLVALVDHPWMAAELDFGRPDKRALAGVLTATDRLVAGLENARGNARTAIAIREELRTALVNARAARPGAWQEFCRVLCDREDQIFSADTKVMQTARAGLGEWAGCYENFAAAYGPLLQQCLATDLAGVWTDWTDFARAFVAWAEGAVVRELNLVTFDDMVRHAARLLATNPVVRREERERLWGLLVDEFQDTDPVQLDLLRQLVGRRSPAEHEVIGFFVGDPKQSIYRFRDADLPAIENFAARYAALARVAPARVQRYRLTTSFRSLKPVLEFVNQFFAHAVPLPGYAAERLAPLRAATGAKPEWRVVDDPPAGATADARRARAATETARLIADHVRQADGDPAVYSEVLVLVNTHEELDAVLTALEAAGIPAVSSGARTFHQRPEVLDALNLLIALHNPQDSLAVGAVLRSPLFGLSDPQIAAALPEVPPREFFATAAPLPPAVPAAAHDRIAAARELTRARVSRPVADWLRAVRAFVPDGVYADQDREGRAVVRIDNVFAAFRRVVELGTIPPLTWLLEQRGRVDRVDNYDAEMGEDVSVTDESVAAVRVMTIHKAKGLQSRLVIVYGWQKALARRHDQHRTKTIVSLTRPDGQPLAGFRLSWGDIEIVSPRHAEAAAMDRQLQAEESARLAYVAATRAQDRLVLLSHDRTDLETGLLAEAGPALTAGAASVGAFGDTATVIVVAPAPPPAAGPGARRRIRDESAYVRLWQERAAALGAPPALQLAQPSQPERPAEDDESDPTDFVGSRSAAARDRARQIGTLVHRYLERHLTETAFDRAQLTALLEEGVAEGVVEKATAVLRRFFGSARQRRARGGTILGRELPVLLTLDGQPWSGVMDLVFAESDRIIGVDYKVMDQPVPLPEQYARQQHVYTTALQRLFPERTVAFEFWWLTEP